jgi:hypothetical protein
VGRIYRRVDKTHRRLARGESRVVDQCYHGTDNWRCGRGASYGYDAPFGDKGDVDSVYREVLHTIASRHLATETF